MKKILFSLVSLLCLSQNSYAWPAWVDSSVATVRKAYQEPSMQDRICKRVEEYELQDNESYFDQSCGSTHLLSVVKVNHTDYVNLLNPKGCRSFVNRVADLQARLSKLSSPSEAMVLASSADVFAQDLEVLWTSVDSEVQMAYNKILQDGAPLSYPCLVRRADLKGFLKSGELNSLKEIRIEALKIKKMASEKYL